MDKSIRIYISAVAFFFLILFLVVMHSGRTWHDQIASENKSMQEQIDVLYECIPTLQEGVRLLIREHTRLMMLSTEIDTVAISLADTTNME